MKRATLMAILLVTAAMAHATEPLVGDRPDFTESARTVAPGSVQLEAGATLDTSEDADRWTVGEVLVRYGLEAGTELRLIAPSYLTLEAGDADKLDGVGNAGIGIKQQLTDAGPRVAAITTVTLPTGSDDVIDSATAVDLALAIEWDLTDHLGLGMNAGAELVFDDDNSTQQWLSAALGLAASGRLGLFVESFVFTEELDRFASYLSFGATYLLTDDLAVDARVGLGLGDHEDEHFYGAGLVTRF